MTAKIVRSWFAKLGAKTFYIDLEVHGKMAIADRFNGKLRDECLNGEIFYSLKEARVVQQWRNHYNTVRPHSSSQPSAASTPNIHSPITSPGSQLRDAIYLFRWSKISRQVTAILSVLGRALIKQALILAPNQGFS